MQIHSHEHLRSWRNRVQSPTAKVTQLPVATVVSVIKRPESCVPAPLTSQVLWGWRLSLLSRCLNFKLPPIIPSVSPLRCISVYLLLDVQICELATIFMWWTETTVLHWVCFTECRLVEGKAKAALHSTMLLTSLSILSIFWISTAHMRINTLVSQSAWL